MFSSKLNYYKSELKLMVKKILFIDNGAHHVYGQSHIMDAFSKLGYSISVLVPDDKHYVNKIIDKGYEVIPIVIDGKSMNPVNNLLLIGKFISCIDKISPDLICSFTIKPNLYGAIAARKFNIPIIANITGLGYVFMQKGILHSIVVNLYKFAFKKLDHAFFQNPDDQQLMCSNEVFQDATEIDLLPGSGVDLNKFPYSGVTDNSLVFLFSGRLLWDKGLEELVGAMRIIKIKYPNARLIIIGNYFLANPNGVKPEIVDSWVKEGIVEYKGMVDNVEEVMREMSCMVLPSYYREGIPRVLMEASSMGKPIITVDSVGCREVIDDGINGFIAKPRDINSLAEAMLKFIELPFDKKVEMGLQGRRKMEREFDQQIVIKKYLDVAAKLLNKNQD